MFAALFAISFFVGVPTIFAQIIWPEIMALKESYELCYGCFFVMYSIFQHNLISWTANLIYYIFYHFEFDFIERYKSNSLDWPWNENPE